MPSAAIAPTRLALSWTPAGSTVCPCLMSAPCWPDMLPGLDGREDADRVRRGHVGVFHHHDRVRARRHRGAGGDLGAGARPERSRRHLSGEDLLDPLERHAASRAWRRWCLPPSPHSRPCPLSKTAERRCWRRCRGRGCDPGRVQAARVRRGRSAAPRRQSALAPRRARSSPEWAASGCHQRQCRISSA